MHARNTHETPVTDPESTQATPRAGQLPSWAVSILRLAITSVVLGIIFAWFGVYQTSQFPFPERVAYWTLLMAVGATASIIVNPWVFNRWLPGAHPAVQIAVVSALISVPVTIGLVILEAASDGTLSPPDWWWQQYFYVIVLSAILTAGAWGVELLRAQKTAPPRASRRPARRRTCGGALQHVRRPPARQIPRRRNPCRLRRGPLPPRPHQRRETMILMRLADAIRELSALPGMQTHRSWWVAKQGLGDTARGDGKVMLKLKSGAEAPVSRTYLKAVKDAGWL